MKKQLILTSIIVLLIFNSSLSQVVSSSSNTQPTTVKPEELAGSSFNGDVNLFTGTYGASYTVGSVATPGGLKYDVTMVYSSSLSAGDNVPVASGIPYGEGWGVQVPTISVSVADYMKYSEQNLLTDGYIATNSHVNDMSKEDLTTGLYWFSPMIDIPGVVSGRAVFKHLDPITNAPIFVLEAFENQYVEVLFWADTWEVYLPDGTTYYFSGSSVNYRKGTNRRVKDSEYSIPSPLIGLLPSEVLKVEENIKPIAERLNWHCSVIRNRNLPGQSIQFNYKGFGKFNFFKEFSYSHMPKLSMALNHNNTVFIGGGLPDLEVTSDIFLYEVMSTGHDVSAIDRVVLEYGSESYGNDMLNPTDEGVQRLDSLYNYKTVYSSSTSHFDGWNQYLHPKHPDIINSSSPYHTPSPNNPFHVYNNNYPLGVYFKRSLTTNLSTNSIAFNHSFLESPRIGTSSSGTKLIGGDIYEIKSKIYGNSSSTAVAYGFANVDINIATGKISSLVGNSAPDLGINIERIAVNDKDQDHTYETIFSTFGNAVKWNPAATSNDVVNTSNFFTMPNLPLEYDGINIQFGPANSDNFFDLSPWEITLTGDIARSAHHTYWRENQSDRIPIFRNPPVTIKQYYDRVPSNFGVGLPWQMMKAIAHRFLNPFGGGSINIGSTSDLFKFWWNDDVIGMPNFNHQNPNFAYSNVPTLLDENVRLSNVELIRYSKNPYMLQSVKTYKVNGETTDPLHANPGIILVNQFDLDYSHEHVLVLDNAVYPPGTSLNNIPNRWTNTYLLTKIKNVPVNGSQDLNNILPLTTTEVPTTHFNYEPYPPGIPVSGLNNDGSPEFRTLTTLYVLNKVISHLGKETSINYYPYDHNNVGFNFGIINPRYLSTPPLTLQGVSLPQNSLLEKRNFAVQINIPVQSISIIDPTIGVPKKWDYHYIGGSFKNNHGPYAINYYYDSPSVFSALNSMKTGFETTTVTEPELDGYRSYSVYHHSIADNHLFGKLIKVESFNSIGVKQKEKEIIYEVKKAFVNGIRRNDNTGDYFYDYADFDNTTIFHNPIHSTIYGERIISRPLLFLETAFPNLTSSDSYFIKKVKEIDTEYESMTCNIPDNDGTLDPSEPADDQRPSANQPSEPITNVQSKEGDNILIGLINNSKLGKNLDDDLIAASPLSDNVLISFLEKTPYYKSKTYKLVLENQPTISDAVFFKILALPTNIRENVVRDVVRDQQYHLSSNTLRQIIATQPPLDPSIIENALKQYNDLPEDILLSIINRNPKYNPELIASVLLSQVELSEQVHQLLLAKTYLPDDLIKKVFTKGASYPSENTLIAMINRQPVLEKSVIKNILLASPFYHTQLTMDALAIKYGNNLVSIIVEHNTSLPSWTAYCGNSTTITPLSIQTITEYEYWDANEQGETTSSGFRKLMDVNDASIHLMYEPSWQLYKTKTYSPQLTGAYTEKEYFYYYDLKNKFRRREAYLPNSIFYAYDIDNRWVSYGYIPFVSDGVNGEPVALRLSHEFNLRNIAYQERTTSKNVTDSAPISRSTFYHYDNVWNTIVDNVTPEIIEYNDPESCSPNNSEDDDSDETGGTGGIPRCTPIDFKEGVSTALIGKTVYKAPGSGGYYACPCNYYNPTMTLIDSNCDFNGSDDEVARAPMTNMLKNILQLKEVNTQIDTLINDEYYASLGSIPFPSSTGLMEFKITDEIDLISNKNIYVPIYPFDVLKVKEIKERNQYTQVQLEANEKGLLTRYWYTKGKPTFYRNTACQLPNGNYPNSFGNYSGDRQENIGVPIAITLGYTRADSLRTEYEYYPDYSVKQITDPNGIRLLYKYDEYGRLKESYRNGELLSVNKYSTWNNDFSLSFLDRTLSNYVETAQLKDAGSNAALQSRKYIDPLGRDFHTMSAEVPDYTGTSTINWRYFEITYSGSIVYDNWNRAVETYKPFVDGDGVTPLSWNYVPNSLTNSTTNSLLYPHISSFASYENDQKSRVLREAKPGEVLNTAHNVKYKYSMANYVCGGCELELTKNESDLILGTNATDVRFKVVEVEDEDGKVSKEYFNALGQKVATKQFIGLEEAITLFVYDSYGNLTKVINPEKQESNYHYNMLGWLYQKETVDGGITKYMFNESGQVVLEQDANARLATNCDNNTEQPYYRQYDYDIYGRLTSQSKKYYQPTSLDMSANIHLPMLYTSSFSNVTLGGGPIGQDLFHDGTFYNGTANAYVYNFTNNSTYAWKAKTYFLQPQYSGSNQFFAISNYDMVYNLPSYFEKQLYYGEPITMSANYHSTTSDILTNNRRNMKGNLSHAAIYDNPICGKGAKLVKYDFYSYNNNGNLDWQMQQFNANGIDPSNKGLVVRIDYPNYDLNNNLLVENVDINNDLELDMQYHYTYDYRNRIREVRVSLADEKENGQLLASYDYNNATGLVTKTNYNKDCISNENAEIASIDYLYDVRDRLTNINSDYLFDYNLYYDNNMPSTVLGNLTTISNFNGNINGTKATYKLSGVQGYNAGNNFDKPTSYAYKYDGINRLTEANAYWDEGGLATGLNQLPADFGDVMYEFDKIGNLTRLRRTVDANGLKQDWNYIYQSGSNKLTQLFPNNVNTTFRNYTYDAAGNLLSDDYRNVNQSIYGRANLPFDLNLNGTKATQYLYDASDARIFKGVYSFNSNFALGITDNSLGVVETAEFYLRDAAGNTIGILDYNTGAWTWYVFGRERFAKITPLQSQQPLFFAKDNKDLQESINQDRNRDLFIAEVKNVLESDPTVQTQLLNIQCKDSTCFWISENNLSSFTDTVPETDYTIVQEYNLKNTNQLVSIDNELISVGVLAEVGLNKSDSLITLPDTISNALYDEQGKMIGEPKFNYTYHAQTKLDDISYYMFDHLGNTRVVFKPIMIDQSFIVNEDFNDASKFSNEVNDEFIGSSPCVGCPNWKGYNSLITNVSYDNGRIRCEENQNYTNLYYGLTMPFPTENLKTYKVSFDFDGDGSQLSMGASIRADISNGTVANGTQIFVYPSTGNHVEFTFQAQGTLHRLNMIARNTDPYVYPKHFYIDNVQISEVGATSTCKVEYSLEYAADYFPYGKVLREYNPQTEKYLTTHHERDKETGLDYRGARYYDSDVARMLSLDPKAVDYPSLSVYNYVAGNPCVFIDKDGKEITVARVEREGQKPLLKISFTAELINTSSQKISTEKLTSIRDAISSQIQDSYGGEFQDFDVEVTTAIKVLEGSFESQTDADNKIGLKTGHTIQIVDSSDPDFKTNDIGSTERISKEYGNIKINSSIINNDAQLKRTGAHEFGHAAGLNHPGDKNASKADNAAGIYKNNLMHQSTKTSGTDIVEGQIKQIESDNK